MDMGFFVSGSSIYPSPTVNGGERCCACLFSLRGFLAKIAYIP